MKIAPKLLILAATFIPNFGIQAEVSPFTSFEGQPNDRLGRGMACVSNGTTTLFAFGSPGKAEVRLINPDGTPFGTVVNEFADGGSNLGGMVRDIGDYNRDGFQDFIVGDPVAAAAIIFLPNGTINAPGSVQLTDTLSDGDFLFGTDAVWLRNAVAGSTTDPVLAISSPGFFFSSEPPRGRVSIFNSLGTVTSFTVGTLGDKLGQSLAALEDLDSNTFGELVVGSPGALSNAGKITIYGVTAFSSLVPLTTIDAPSDALGFGTSLSTFPDVTGDGVHELLIGAPQTAGGIGRTYLGSCGLGGCTMLCAIDGPAGGGLFGETVQTLGDINGDSLLDFAVGAPQAAGGAGQIFIYSFLPSSTTPSCALQTSISGSHSAEGFGRALGGRSLIDSGCNFNNDGFSDFGVGSVRNVSNEPLSGRALIYRGSDDFGLTPSPTPPIPTEGTINFKVTAKGNVKYTLTLNSEPLGNCELTTRIKSTTGARRGKTRTLIDKFPLQTQATTFVASNLPSVTRPGCERPAAHILGVVTCGSETFLTNVGSQYMNCETEGRIEAGDWITLLTADIHEGTSAEFRPQKNSGGKKNRLSSARFRRPKFGRTCSGRK